MAFGAPAATKAAFVAPHPTCRRRGLAKWLARKSSRRVLVARASAVGVLATHAPRQLCPAIRSASVGGSHVCAVRECWRLARMRNQGVFVARAPQCARPLLNP
nr:hypothetical protein [Kibdelosporangium sp. MJ126-NF4]CTQ94767.1 hypothetical protein [Kibdelosporangium sp. MJ126-NF4]